VSADTSAVPPDASAPGRRPRLGPGALLRLEGLLLLAATLAVYGGLGVSWWWFAGLLLAPDVGLLGYLVGDRVGATAYNLTHTLSLPVVLGLIGLTTGGTGPLAAAAIWAAHIGMDRALGYGLKYPGDVRDTHLQRVA
jgi:hypothetical protein